MLTSKPLVSSAMSHGSMRLALTELDSAPQWPSAAATKCEQNVVELGCGACALPGRAAAAMGFESVTLTDGAPALLPVLRKLDGVEVVDAPSRARQSTGDARAAGDAASAPIDSGRGAV